MQHPGRRINRFYQPGKIIVGNDLQLCKRVSNHAKKVLRLKAPDQIQLFNGDGMNYLAELIGDTKTVKVFILSSSKTETESPLKIHLGQALSKGDKMDFTLQKSVELGVTEITPLISQRVQFRFDENRTLRKMQHWQKIIESTCEQSGRSIIPQLNPPMDLYQWLQKKGCPGLLLVAGTRHRLMDIERTTSIRLLVGPEGGLSDDEIQFALDKNFTGLSLGPRILRTETAALTAISILQATFGDL